MGRDKGGTVTERQNVLDALDRLPNSVWFLALYAARGVIQGMAEVAMDNPEVAVQVISVLDEEFTRLEKAR